MMNTFSNYQKINVFNDAQNRIFRYFSNGGWELYDGVEVQQDNQITINDMVLSIALNSRIDRNKVWYLWQNLDVINGALSQIPVRIHLTHDHELIPWQELHILFEGFCDINYVGESLTTKILHKKRPKLIPVYDDVLGQFFKPQFKGMWSRGGGPFLVRYLELIRDQIIIHQEEVDELCMFARNNGWDLTPVRVVEVLIWIANEGNGEYR